MAISHVWADGLGNKQANALPKCQLRSLQTIIEGLPLNFRHRYNPLDVALAQRRTRYLWLDTFCIPVRPGSQTLQVDRVRQMAINSMSLIYANAAPTLVLDAELRRLDQRGSGDADGLRQFLRLDYSRMDASGG